MKLMRFALLLLVAFIYINGAGAQTADPTHWTFEVKKKDNRHYQLIFHLKLDAGYHIYSVNPGGDGSLIPPTFDFKNNIKVIKNGKIKESGKMLTQTFDGVDGKVNLYNGTVDYTQDVTVTGNATIKGSHQYQVCNDKMCLRPTTKDFVFEIK